MKLSIIMPCYNVENTIERAIDSIYMQEVNFNFEVIIINDCSTDSTLNILRKYSDRYKNIKIIENDKNMGNALSFKKGIAESSGKYFTVLDGDDFYTINYKLQKQVDFLDIDKDKEYAAVSHKFLMVNDNLEIVKNLDIFNRYTEYTFFDFLNLKFYYHTSTMMYRNIFRGVDVKILEKQRGDTIRTFLVMKSIYGKVKILNFIGSVYTINSKGIWSSLNANEKIDMHINLYRAMYNYVESKKEKNLLKRSLSMIARNNNSNNNNNLLGIEVYLSIVKNYIDNICSYDNDIISRNIYQSIFIDSFCETIGYIVYCSEFYKKKDYNRQLRFISTEKNTNNLKNIVIIASYLSKIKKDIKKEILEIATIYQYKKVYILLTDTSSINDIPFNVVEEFNKISNLVFICAGNIANKTQFLHKKIRDIKPYKIYYYCEHNNCCINALIQDYGAKNIFIFSMENGLSLGLNNSKIDLYIAKTPKDYKLLRSKYDNKVIYIPYWNKSVDIDFNYRPFNKHNVLYTSSASASINEYKNQFVGDFLNFIINILSTTKGKHFHYGPISEDIKKRIYKRLKLRNIPIYNFVHIEHEDSLLHFFINNNIDLFISPLTNCIELNISIMSIGIPILIYTGGITRIEQVDYLHPEVLKWYDIDSFSNIILHLVSLDLQYQSVKQKDFFSKNNDLRLLAPYILFDKEFESVPLPPSFIDGNIVDIDNILDLLTCF